VKVKLIVAVVVAVALEPAVVAGLRSIQGTATCLPEVKLLL
jgi:hypothetical protein